MTDKAYIVANKEQELEVLNKLDEYGFMWVMGDKPSAFIPSEEFRFTEADFPYMLITNDIVWWSNMDKLKNQTILYDGRNGYEEVDTRYKVTQKFMNELNEWKQANFNDDFMFLNGDTIADFSDVINNWWYSSLNDRERNNRLITIVQWLNGEDVFKVEQPHKFVVRSKHADKHGYYNYVKVVDHIALSTDLRYAMEFDTREEAQGWANSHQVVVEIGEEGNEVE